jgi:hypothetical protein
MPGGGREIEVVRGRLGEGWGERILSFWAERGALQGEVARERLAEVVCVLLDESGAVAGVNSVYEESIPLVGGRRFHVYRVLLPDGAAGDPDEMFVAAFEALDAEFQSAGGPVGVCVAVSRDQIAGDPDAFWPATGLAYAGTQPDGSQLRIRYFGEATIAPGMEGSPTQAAWLEQDHSLHEGHRIVPIADTDAVDEEDVLAMWTAQGVVRPGEAERRMNEVLMVALGPGDELAGVSTVYLQSNRQLGMSLWHYRTFVAPDHRMENLSLNLLWASRDHLRDRFVSGEDETPGMLMEVENEFLKSYYNTGYWVISDFTFIGESELGAHVRVHYFPGARVPIPG